ncbi:exosome non-catalytic core subunit rrp46 [Pseudocyphellaria aurata]|nr:exosome non-catalytic core subunit rrp46 [Pseudocyphellaria aurata]
MPSTILAPLDRADGSAAYSYNGFSIIGGINGPVEVQRRDELPEEAAIDVVVRPIAGVGGIRERHLESIIERTLRHTVVVTAHPRTLIQVTLQVIATQEEDSASGVLPQAASNIQLLPALLQTSMLALLSTSIPLSQTFTSTLVVVDPHGRLVPDPSAQQVHSASSVHVFAFSSRGDLLLVESEGSFDLAVWEQVVEQARQICLGGEAADRDRDIASMDAPGPLSLQNVMRNTMQERMVKEQRWKNSLG